MALCQAIVQDGYHACKNKARHGHDTCTTHKSFFNKRTWFNKFILGENKHHDTVLLGYDPQHSATGRLTEHTRKVLHSGRVDVTKEDICSIPADSSTVDAFLVLCELPHVDPNWNKRLIVESVKTYYYILLGYQENLRNYNPYKTQELRLGPLLKNPHMGFSRTLKFMLAVKEMRSRTRRLTNQPENYYDEVFQMLFLDYNDEYAWYATETLMSLLVPQGAATDYFQTKVVPLLKRRAPQLKRAKKMRLDPLKEELVSVVYHPDNVSRWLEEGGYELLDMMF
jgi:hypothetical protein